ncbi:ethanolaminephosphotransferase 1 [Bipolaris maydis]|nr:ethanolaminephosphotransferase 1 [Bipolaris maydis]
MSLPHPVTTPTMPPSKETKKHECVSEDALQHLRTYKYSSVDKSFISRYILKHYWNAFVELLPLWLAPNLVYIPDLVGPAPSWVYYSFAFGMWMYSTMDNVDGKASASHRLVEPAGQTRQTTSLTVTHSHGIDSLNCTLASLLETAAVGYGSTKIGAFTALIPVLPMFFSTWETYHTHTLYLGYFNGPTEGLILACTFICLSGYFGPEIWSTPLANYFPSYKAEIGDITIKELWVPILLFTFFVAHLPECILNIARARRARNQPVLPLLKEWTPLIIFVVCTMAWLGSPYSSLLEDNHLVLYCLTMSLVFGRMTTKIILAHLTHQPFPYWTLWYLRAYFVFAFIVYGKWAHLVITSICDYLGIKCFTIPVKPNEKNQRSNGVVDGKGRTD